MSTHAFPPFESYWLDSLRVETIDYYAPPHAALTVLCLNQRNISPREVARITGLRRPEVTNLLRVSGFARPPAGSGSQWKAKPGFEDHFHIDRNKGYLLTPKGCKALAKVMYDLRVAGQILDEDPTPHAKPWLAYFPQRPNLMAILGQAQDFSLLEPLHAYLVALDRIRELGVEPGSVSTPLPFTELVKVCKVPTELRSNVWLEFLGSYFHLKSASSVQAPLGEMRDYYIDGGFVRPYGVFILYVAWDEVMRLRRRKSAVQTPANKPQPTPPIPAPAPKTEPPALETPIEGYEYKHAEIDDMAPTSFTMPPKLVVDDPDDIAF